MFASQPSSLGHSSFFRELVRKDETQAHARTLNSVGKAARDFNTNISLTYPNITTYFGFFHFPQRFHTIDAFFKSCTWIYFSWFVAKVNFFWVFLTTDTSLPKIALENDTIPNKIWIFILSLFDGPNKLKRLTYLSYQFCILSQYNYKKKDSNLKLFTQTSPLL